MPDNVNENDLARIPFDVPAQYSHELDKYAVAYVLGEDKLRVLQTETTIKSAIEARDIVNDHEERNGRPRKFFVAIRMDRKKQ